MGQKTSKSQSKKLPEQPPKQNEFAMYLLPDNEEETLARAQLQIAAYGNNAVILSPDPNDSSSSSSGAQKYNTRFIIDRHWLQEKNKNVNSINQRKTKSINFNLRDAKLIASQEYPDIQLISPKTPKYQNILNTALNFASIQQLSPLESMADVIHKNVIAPDLDNRDLASTIKASKTLYGFYKPEETKRIVKKLLEHAVYATADDIKGIKKILNAPLSQKQPDLEYLRELLRTPGTVKGYKDHDYEKRTLYQIALAAREYNVTSENGIQVVDGLIEMLGEYFKKLPDGEMLQKQQYDAQFPEGFEEKENQRILNDSRDLKRVLDVVTKASDADCQQTMALDSFHGYDLRPPRWASTNNEVLASAIYLQAAAGGLTCRFRGLDGEVKTKLISWDTLPGVPHSVDDIITKKHACLPKILEQLAEPGQFYTAEQIQKLKVLSHTTVCAISQNDFNGAWKALQDYMKSIAGGFINFNVLEALYQFRNHLEPKGGFTTGYHSNPQLLLESYQLYDKNFEPFGNNWSSPKNVLCVEKIAGLAQRDLSACELQLHAQEPYGVLAKGDKSKRTYSFTYGGGSVLPIDSDPCFRLGYNYFAARGWDAIVAYRAFSIWNSYVKQKHQRSKAYATSWKSIEEHSRDEVGLRRNS